jgi:hypothetical protein
LIREFRLDEPQPNDEMLLQMLPDKLQPQMMDWLHRRSEPSLPVRLALAAASVSMACGYFPEKLELALSAWRQVVEECDRQASPKDTDLWDILATLCISVSWTLGAQGNEAPVAQLRSAMEKLDRLVAGGQRALRPALARVRLELSQALAGSGSRKEGLAELHETVSLFEELVQEGRKELCEPLVSALNVLGSASRQEGKTAEAAVAYRRALDVIEVMVRAGQLEAVKLLGMTGHDVLNGACRGELPEQEAKIMARRALDLLTNDLGRRRHEWPTDVAGPVGAFLGLVKEIGWSIPTGPVVEEKRAASVEKRPWWKLW